MAPVDSCVLILFWLCCVVVLAVVPQHYWNVISDLCTVL